MLERPMMGRRAPRGWRLQWMVPLLLALCAAACTTTTVRAPARVAQHAAPAVAEASAVAQTLATMPADQRQAASARIDRLLATLDDATLAREAAALAPDDPLYDFAGRALLNRGLPLPHPFARGGHWRFDAGNRPPAAADGYRPPVQLAVLLPLSGSLSAAALPVRDGLLAGYYAEQRQRPQLRFYDTAGGAVAAYGKAVADGADFVLGPLGRDEVGALFQRGSLEVPVLALNRAATAPPPGSASFSLAPEDDGIAAAEFLLARRAGHVLVLADADDSMRRAVAAFREQFEQRGGTIASQLQVGAEPGDMGVALSQAAASAGGVDSVFLALRPRQAAALAPQLAQAGLSGRPMVATSQLASANDETTSGHALDGIAFPSEAWATHPVAGLPSADRAAAMLPSAAGAAQRLFAFGHDAWLLTAYLERLANDANATLPGATGRLRLDGFGNVVRAPAWSTHSGSVVLPLGNAGG
jgi:outer membrane PBP1 activator LpoA protein